MQAVEGVLRARHELGRHEEEAVHRVGPLASGGDNQVGGASVGVGIHFRSVVALTSGVLAGGEHRQVVAAVAQPEVEGGFSGVDVVVGLFGYHRHMGRKLEIVASAAVFVGIVIFDGELADVGSAEEAACSECLCLELCHFGESVAVVVISVAAAALSVDEEPRKAVVGDHRCVEGGVVVKRSRGADRRQLVRYLCGVGHRIFGDDVDGASYGR